MKSRWYRLRNGSRGHVVSARPLATGRTGFQHTVWMIPNARRREILLALRGEPKSAVCERTGRHYEVRLETKHGYLLEAVRSTSFLG